MPKVIQFRTRSQKFQDWVDEVLSSNELMERADNIENALFIWYDKKAPATTHIARYNCELNDLEYLSRSLDAHITDVRIAEFLKNHIHEFLEYIN